VRPDLDDSGFAKIWLPHSVVALSWQNWDPARWKDVWVYRRHFSIPPAFRGRRVFVDFTGVMTGANPVINGPALPSHWGGYLPFQHETPDRLVTGDNVLVVAVDSRWSNVPSA
jgi:beta-galactosidase